MMNFFFYLSQDSLPLPLSAFSHMNDDVLSPSPSIIFLSFPVENVCLVKRVGFLEVKNHSDTARLLFQYIIFTFYHLVTSLALSLSSMIQLSNHHKSTPRIKIMRHANYWY
jgi:hypothetical protein